MARKIFCDGCDNEISVATVVSISYAPPAGAQGIKPVTADLCSGCLNHFNRHKLPKTWPRADLAPVEAA